ncbi:MAG: alpha/beta hydrolase [Verrucomicrobia bacterium]|nr:alpha/beta hydrolase [Verrucomicrobiota bacterium]MBV8278130.1 alpha/beta hydrolase [Verrucomicrobiota bacterium]
MESFIVETRRGRIYVQTQGTGVPLVFIHGALLNSGLWTQQIETFSDLFTCVAYDLRGHGRSGSSDEKRYSIGTFADDLAEMLDALELRRPILCGLSMGGMIAQSFAAKYPERVRALVLCDTGVSTCHYLTDKILNQAIGLVTPTATLLGVSEFRRFTHLINQCFGDRSWVAQSEQSVDFVADAVRIITPQEVVKIVTAIRKFDSSPLYRPKLPALILNGESDSPFILRQAKILQRAYSGADYRIIPKAGHLANLDNPGIFDLMMLEFLSELASKRAREFAVMAWLSSTLAKGRSLIKSFTSKSVTRPS